MKRFGGAWAFRGQRRLSLHSPGSDRPSFNTVIVPQGVTGVKQNSVKAKDRRRAGGRARQRRAPMAMTKGEGPRNSDMRAGGATPPGRRQVRAIASNRPRPRGRSSASALRVTAPRRRGANACRLAALAEERAYEGGTGGNGLPCRAGGGHAAGSPSSGQRGRSSNAFRPFG
jgi:hypothetical protein